MSSKQKMKRFVAAGAVVALSLSMVACSGSKLGSASGDTTAASETEATDAAPTGDSDSKFCRTARELEEESNSLDALGDAPTPDDVKKAFNAALNAFEEISKDAPDDIKGDMEFVIDKYGDLLGIIKDNGYDITKAFADPEFQKLTQDEEIQIRGDKVDDYLTEVCGVGDEASGADDAAGS